MFHLLKPIYPVTSILNYLERGLLPKKKEKKASRIFPNFNITGAATFYPLTSSL